MSENQQSHNSENSDNEAKTFDSMFFLTKILAYKKFIIILTAVGMIASVIISLLMPNWYKSTINAVPPQKSTGTLFEGAMGAVTSTLKEFGLTKFGGRTEGYSFLVILNSRSVKDSLIKKFNLAKVYEIPDTLKSEVYKALEENLDITNEKEGNYTVTIYDKNPQRAAEMTNYYLEIANNVAQNIFRIEATTSRLYIESRLEAIDSVLTQISDSLKIYSKQKFVFSPLDQAKAVSSAYADLKAQEIQQDVVYELMKNKFGETDPYTLNQKKLLENLKSKVNDAENKSGFFGNFPLTEAAGVGIEYLRLYTSYEIYFKVKGFLMPMLEDARLDESRNTKSLIVVDKAVPADKKAYPKRSLIVLGSTFGVFILSLLFILLIESIKHLRFKIKNYHLSNNLD